MADIFRLQSSSQSYRTMKQVAHGSARTKGTPVVVNGWLMVPYDDYAAGDDQLLIYAAEEIIVTSTGDNVEAEIASVSFTLGDIVYWDPNNANITTSKGSAGNDFTPVGRALETKDMSADRVAGDTLCISLEPDLRLTVKPVAGAAQGYKIARGETALDGANPTAVATGLTTVVSFVATLKGTSAPGVGTSVLTASISGATANVYAWKPTSSGDATLVASTGTESFYWIAVGT